MQATDIHFLVSWNYFGMPPSDTSAPAILTKPLTPLPLVLNIWGQILLASFVKFAVAVARKNEI